MKTIKYLDASYECWSEWGEDWVQGKSLGELADCFAGLAAECGEDSHLVLSMAKGCRCMRCNELQIISKEDYNSIYGD